MTVNSTWIMFVWVFCNFVTNNVILKKVSESGSPIAKHSCDLACFIPECCQSLQRPEHHEKVKMSSFHMLLAKRSCWIPATNSTFQSAVEIWTRASVSHSSLQWNIPHYGKYFYWNRWNDGRSIIIIIMGGHDNAEISIWFPLRRK